MKIHTQNWSLSRLVFYREVYWGQSYIYFVLMTCHLTTRLQCQGQENLCIYTHFSIRLHGVVHRFNKEDQTYSDIVWAIKLLGCFGFGQGFLASSSRSDRLWDSLSLPFIGYRDRKAASLAPKADESRTTLTIVRVGLRNLALNLLLVVISRVVICNRINRRR
jgi:hypothetical protein